MSLKSNAIITLEYFKEIMGITTSTNDALYEHLINAVSAYVDKYIGFTLVSTVYTNEMLDGTGQRTLVLPAWPITAFSNLESAHMVGSDKTWNTVETSIYDVEFDRGILEISGRFIKGRGNYRATFTAGYTAETMPDDLKLAVAEMVEQSKVSRRINRLVSSERLKNYAVTYKAVSGVANADTKEILDSYRGYRV